MKRLLLCAWVLAFAFGCAQGARPVNNAVPGNAPPPPAANQAAAPKEKTASGRLFAKRIPEAAGLENFAQVTPSLYRGAQPTVEGFKQLQQRGVKTIISLRSWHGEEQAVIAAGMEPIAIPVQADVRGSEPPSEAQVAQFFKVVLDPGKQPVYFHCKHGKDRTGTMGALYRIEIDGWSADEAIEEMQAFGYHDIFEDLIAYVRAYKKRGYQAKMASETR